MSTFWMGFAGLRRMLNNNARDLEEIYHAGLTALKDSSKGPRILAMNKSTAHLYEHFNTFYE